jgi:hypothetical protein
VLQPDSLKLLGYNFAEKLKIFKFLLFFNIFYAKKMTCGIARVSKLVSFHVASRSRQAVNVIVSNQNKDAAKNCVV